MQILLTSHVDELPDVLRNRLQNFRAETFYREFFCGPDKEPFGVLYADVPLRPNAPINVLTALEFLKATSGWTDEAPYSPVCYETCDPENSFQRITQVQVASNTVDNSRLLAAAVPTLGFLLVRFRCLQESQ